MLTEKAFFILFHFFIGKLHTHLMVLIPLLILQFLWEEVSFEPELIAQKKQNLFVKERKKADLYQYNFNVKLKLLETLRFRRHFFIVKKRQIFINTISL